MKKRLLVVFLALLLPVAGVLAQGVFLERAYLPLVEVPPRGTATPGVVTPVDTPDRVPPFPTYNTARTPRPTRTATPTMTTET